MNDKSIKTLVEKAEKIVIIQADNPDGDSLGSSLALEAILSDLGKKVTMYCSVDIPTYLSYMKGSDRVVKQLPNNFDLSIIVDTGSILLLENLVKSGEINWLKTKPCIVIDHHNSESTIDFAALKYIEPAVATGELIYKIAKQNNWTIQLDGAEHIVNAIMSDSLGLITESTSSASIRTVADLVDVGVSLAKLDAERRKYQKKQPEILAYKGQLLQRIEYSNSAETAYITIPWEEIEKFSPLYNPSMLVIDEMRQVENVKVAVAFKSYPDGRITAKLRSNYGYPVCDKVAEKFGGGGHSYTSGFKIHNSDIDDVITKTLKYIDEELKTVEIPE